MFLNSCTRPVSIRPLPETPASQASKLVLDDRLSARDIRELLESLNEHGDLQNVAHYWREPGDEELEEWAEWLTQFVFESSGDPRGLVALLDRYVGERRISSLESDMRRWRGEPTFFAEREFWFHALTHADFDPIFERDYRLLNPSIWRAWSETWVNGDFRFVKPRFDTGALVVELGRLLNPDSRESFETVLAEASRKHAVPSLFDTALHYRKHYGPVAFRVLETGLNGMLTTPPENETSPQSNQLEQLVAFASSANQSSHGLFEAIEMRLRGDEGEAVGEELRKWAVESLSDLDTENVLESVHRVLALVPPTLFRSAKELLLGRFRFGNLGPFERDEVLANFPEAGQEALRVMLEEWFDSVQSLAALDRQYIPAGPTLFVAYRDLLRRTAAEDVGWLSSFYDWAHKGKFFHRDADGRVESRFWTRLLIDGQGVQILRTVADLPERPRTDFKDAIQQALQGTDDSPRAGVQIHLGWLEHVLDAKGGQTEGFRATLARFFDSNEKNPLLLDDDDWRAVERFALEKGHRIPRSFFAKHSDRVKAWQAVQTLLRLTHEGKMKRPIALLKHVDTPAARRIAEVFARWESSGELAAALRTLELFFRAAPAADGAVGP